MSDLELCLKFVITLLKNFLPLETAFVLTEVFQWTKEGGNDRVKEEVESVDIYVFKS